MTVLVTGGAGFIGSHLLESLLTDGERVVCLDNLSSGVDRNLEPVRDNARFTFVNGDVRADFESLLADAGLSPDRVDRVYHLASRASPVDFEEYALDIAWTSAAGAYNALDFAAAVDARLVLVSTSEVYGQPEVHPQPETYNGNVDPRGPRAPYDEGNRFAETLAVAFEHEQGVDVRTVRPFNTYGSRMRPDDGRVVPTFVRQALCGTDLTIHGDGSQTRSFLHVSDTVRGLRALMATEGLSGTVVNVGSERELSIRDLAACVRSVVENDVGLSSEPRPSQDPDRRQADASRARELLDWEPRVDLETGLELTAAAMRERLVEQGELPDS
jgi:UDP-glucuronate decarboxylase